MSKLQFIFDNPRKRKKGKKAMAKKKKKTSKRKNPMRVKYKAVNKKTKEVIKPKRGGTGVFPTDPEVKSQELAIARLKEAKRRTKARKKKTALSKKVTSATKKLQLMRKARKAAVAEVKNARASVRGSDNKFSAEEIYFPSTRKKKTKKKGSKVAKKKKKTTKKKTKKKAAKKKVVRRKKKATKRKATKKKATKRKKTTKRKATKRKATKKKSTKKKATKKKTTRRRKSKKKKSLSLKKGQSVMIKANAKKKGYKKKYKKNPVGGKMPLQKLQKLIGYKWADIGSFALGGAFYASSNALLARFARPVHDMLAKIPVVGPAMPNFIMGVALNYLSQTVKTKALKDAFDSLGDGLIASSVVGMGVNAAQFVPMLQPMALPGMSGVDYTPELSGMGEYRQRAGDFGDVEYFPGMEGVDYTPEMNGVDFTPGTDTLTGRGSEYSDADYGYESADYGLIPEGLSGMS
jgi:adenylate kinase/ribonuclease R